MNHKVRVLRVKSRFNLIDNLKDTVEGYYWISLSFSWVGDCFPKHKQKFQKIKNFIDSPKLWADKLTSSTVVFLSEGFLNGQSSFSLYDVNYILCFIIIVAWRSFIIFDRNFNLLSSGSLFCSAENIFVLLNAYFIQLPHALMKTLWTKVRTKNKIKSHFLLCFLSFAQVWW